MEQKTFPAFGYFVIRNRIAKNEILNDDLYKNGEVLVGSDFNTCWLYTKGLVNQVNIQSGTVSVRAPGYCNATTKETEGVWRADFLQDSTVFCVPSQQKNPLDPLLIDQLQVFVLAAGQSATLTNGTKLSLCQGSLSVNSTTIPELRQIELKNGDRVVTAIEDCYGLIFP